MTCPKCAGRTRIYDCRPDEAGETKMRRRECLECGYRFKTVEIEINLLESLQGGKHNEHQTDHR